MTSTSRRALVGALVFASVAAGCGGGKKDVAADTALPAAAESTTTTVAGDSTTVPGAAGSATTAKPGTATTKAGSTATTAAGAAAAPTTTLKPTAPANDVATGRGYLLTQPDLGAGYAKKDSSGGTGSGDFDLEACGKGNPVYAKDNPNDLKGDAFAKGSGFDSVNVSSGSTIASSVAQASDAMAIAKTDEFLRCVEDEAKKQAAKSAPPGTTFDVKASRRPLTGADDATDIHLVVSGTFGTSKITGDIDVFTFRKGKFIVAAAAALFGSSNAAEPARVAEIEKKKLG